MAALTVQQITVAGVQQSLAAAAGGGDTFVNDGNRTFFIADNASGGAITLTFDDTGSVAPQGATAFNADVDVSVGAGTRYIIGPFPKSRFGDTVAVTYSGVTSLTVGAMRI